MAAVDAVGSDRNAVSKALSTQSQATLAPVAVQINVHDTHATVTVG